MLIIGVDVSQDSLDCASLVKDTGKQLGQRSFPNAPDGVERLLTWARRLPNTEDASIHLIVEATACYHELIARSVAATNMSVSVANPARVRSFARGTGVLTKTDRIDALVLARYGQLASPKLWKPPAKELEDLQALISRLDEVEADLRREQNRLDQARHRECPAVVLESFLESISANKARKKVLQKATLLHTEAFTTLQVDFKRLLTIPAVGPKTAARMLVLLRSRHFENARQVAAFLGLVPVEHQSGKSIQGRPHLSKAGNPRLRAALYMAAVVAIKVNPDIRSQQARLLGRGKAKMSTLGAAMRKLVHLCFGVLKSCRDYEAPAAVSA